MSGHKRYNNKGEVVEQYEPYFSSGFDYEADDVPAGVAIKMYYDPLGRMVKTINPDDSEQRVYFGMVPMVQDLESFIPTPWERYHYSPNDLAGITNPGSGVPQSSWWTPKSEIIDPLGNVIQTTEHDAHLNGGAYEDVVMKYEFDIKGQLIRSIDPYDRNISVNYYTTAGQMLRTDHIDRGTQRVVMDVLGLPVITNDAKGARTLFSYDALQRPKKIRARDRGSEGITLRQILRYGDSDGLTDPHLKNLNGKIYVHNDEAGRLTYTDYDFKGNLLNFYRQIINDNAVTAFQKYTVNWDNFPSGNLSSTQNTVTQEYDALNRIRKAYYPKDKANQVKVLEPSYNKGGALRAVKVGATNYVSEIAYNARGQRILMAMGNGMMTRYVYDSETFRLARTRSEKFTLSGLTYTPTTGVQQDLGYTYDLEGTILSQRDKAPGSASAQGPNNLLREFGHDPLRRLISATGRESSNVYQQPSWDLNVRPQDYTDTNIYTREYVYDKLGNIQELDHRAVGHSNQDFVRTYNYGTSFANNHLESFEIGSNTFSNTYDANGNLTKEGASRYYYWNAGDKLAAYSNQVGSADPTVFTWYFYNASGERVKKLVKKGQRLEVTFYMDGGMFETSYVKPTGGGIDNNRFYNTLHVLDGSSRKATIRVGTDADDSTPAIKYYLEDHLMDNLVVLNTSGNLVNREEFYPFGETSFGGYGKKRYRFNGKEKDEESGLYNYGQRYYAPWLCRFVSVDPIAEDYPQYTSYNYAGNKPITKIDLEGLQEPGADKQGGAQTDSSGNLTGEYVVKDGQGPTQIAKDLRDVHGVEIDWTSVIDDPRNQKYFESVSDEKRYDKSNKEYENLNLNPGDIVYFNTEEQNDERQIDTQNPEILTEIPFDEEYEQNLPLQPEIANIKHDIQQVKDLIEQKSQKRDKLLSEAAMIQKKMDLIEKTVLKKTPYEEKGTGQEWATIGETIRQTNRELERNSLQKQAFKALLEIQDLKIERAMLEFQVELEYLKMNLQKSKIENK